MDRLRGRLWGISRRSEDAIGHFVGRSFGVRSLFILCLNTRMEACSILRSDVPSQVRWTVGDRKVCHPVTTGLRADPMLSDPRPSPLPAPPSQLYLQEARWGHRLVSSHLLATKARPARGAVIPFSLGRYTLAAHLAKDFYSSLVPFWSEVVANVMLVAVKLLEY